MKVTPASTAACKTASASSSLTLPQSPPSCHAPRPTTPTVRPVRPSMRCSMTAHPSRGGAKAAFRSRGAPVAARGRRGLGGGTGLRPVAEGAVGREAVDAVDDALEQRVGLGLREGTRGHFPVELLLRLRARRGAHVGEGDALRVGDLLERLAAPQPAEKLGLRQVERLRGGAQHTAAAAEAEAGVAGPVPAPRAEEEAALR